MNYGCVLKSIVKDDLVFVSKTCLASVQVSNVGMLHCTASAFMHRYYVTVKIKSDVYK